MNKHQYILNLLQDLHYDIVTTNKFHFKCVSKLNYNMPEIGVHNIDLKWFYKFNYPDDNEILPFSKFKPFDENIIQTLIEDIYLENSYVFVVINNSVLDNVYNNVHLALQRAQELKNTNIIINFKEVINNRKVYLPDIAKEQDRIKIDIDEPTNNIEIITTKGENIAVYNPFRGSLTYEYNKSKWYLILHNIEERYVVEKGSTYHLQLANNYTIYDDNEHIRGELIKSFVDFINQTCGDNLALFKDIYTTKVIVQLTGEGSKKVNNYYGQ